MKTTTEHKYCKVCKCPIDEESIITFEGYAWCCDACNTEALHQYGKGLANKIDNDIIEMMTRDENGE